MGSDKVFYVVNHIKIKNRNQNKIPNIVKQKYEQSQIPNSVNRERNQGQIPHLVNRISDALQFKRWPRSLCDMWHFAHVLNKMS